MDKGFDIRSKIDKMEKDLGEWICDIQSLQNKAHAIRSKLLALGVKTDDFSSRKSFDISKLIPASQNVHQCQNPLKLCHLPYQHRLKLCKL